MTQCRAPEVRQWYHVRTMAQVASSPAVSSTEPYSVRLELTPVGASQSPVFDVYLEDLQVQGIERGEARLDFAEPHWYSFLDHFLRGDVVLHKQALEFGVELATRLVGKDRIKKAWDRALQRRNGRPVRLELVLPSQLPCSGKASGIALDEIPFELMASGEAGFWFRRPGWSLVRTFAGLPAMPYRLPTDSRALLVWANPAVPKDDGSCSTLPQSIFDAHEASFQREAASLGMEVRPPGRRVTRDGLATQLRDGRETQVLALVVHGAPKGGSLVLHAKTEGDEAEYVLPRDLGALCKTGGVRVAFLWACHGARRHALRSSVVLALLEPDHGDLAAVVASHAALVAERTTRFVGPLLRSLRGISEGDLERAVTEARYVALPEDDVQWAAPVYYARPLHGRSVTLAESIAQSIVEPEGITERRVVFGAPAARSWFRGREDESKRTLGIVKAHRLVTLTGMPGIGKTALAVEVSQRALEDAALALTQGFWVDLSAKLSAAVLRDDLALLFGISPDRCPSDLALARAINSSQTLVVLDNAEDLLQSDADGLRALIDTLLRHTKGLRMLVTSRRALGHLDGVEEHISHVGRIAPGVDREVFVAVAGERLEAEPRDEATLHSLMLALEGHPQSIVLIAGQVGRGLSLRELKTRVEAEDAEVVREAALLDEELGGADSKLRTRRLVSSLNLSFAPLIKTAPRAAEMFVWLAAFPSGLPEVLATQVFGDEAKRWAAQLLAMNLIERRGPDLRWVLPGPVRWYARARRDSQFEGRVVLERERRDELLERSVQALAGWLEVLNGKLGKTGSAAACARAQDDGANVIAVALIAQNELPTNRQLISGLASSFAHYSALANYSGLHSEAVSIGERIFPVFARSQDPASIALVAERLGDLYVRTARLAEAQRFYEQALPIYRDIHERLGEADTLQSLGDLCVRTDRLAEAQQFYEQALPIFRDIHERLGEANTLQSLGDLYVRTARLAEAQQFYEQALPIYRDIQERLGEANTLKSLGALYVLTARLAEAQRFYVQALPIYRDIHSRRGEANTLKSLGDLSVRTDRLAEAQRFYEQALPIYRDIHDRLGEANTLQSLGNLYVRMARLAEAQRFYEQALPIYRDIHDRLGEANTLQGIGSLALANHKAPEAFNWYLASLKIQRTVADRLGQGGTHGYLARAAAQAGRSERALVLAARAFALFLEVNDRFGQMLVASDALSLLDQRNDEGVAPVLVFAWATARLIDDSRSQQYEPIIRELGIDPELVSLEELREQAAADMHATFARYEQILADRNEDPYSPLVPQ